MQNEFSFKELEQVCLKTTLPMEINGKTYAKGETIAFFDKIQIANIDEIKNWTAARGGFDNRSHVIWETTQEMRVKFTQGVFSKTQFALLSNAKLLNVEPESPIFIHNREELESNGDGEFTLEKQPPYSSELFIYDKNTGEKLDYGYQDGVFTITEPYKDIIVDYNYIYNNGATIMKVGQRLIEGYLSLEGQTNIKDDITGKTKTGIIKIPKLKLMSELSISLGEKANPVIGNFETLAIPVGNRGNSKVLEMFFLENDIDSDI